MIRNPYTAFVAFGNLGDRVMAYQETTELTYFQQIYEPVGYFSYAHEH